MSGYVRDSIRRRSLELLRASLRTKAKEIQATLNASTELKYASYFPEYLDDPVGFCEDILNVCLWSLQKHIANSLRDNVRTSVRSGHKVGKSLLVVCLALWWVMTRPRGQVVLTSSGKNQVKAILWKELRRVYNAAGGDARFQPQSPVPLDPATGLRFDDSRSIYGFTTDNAERMAGFSGDQLLFCVDEASGFPDPIYEAVQGNLAGGGRILATGNPTKNTGWFFDSHHGKRHLWSTFHVDSRTTPNCIGDEDPIPGLATPEFIESMIEEYGGGNVEEAERSPVFSIRVAGNFAATSDRNVIGLNLIEAGRTRYDEEEHPNHGLLEIGVDVARFGADDTVITGIRDLVSYPNMVIHGFDNVQVAGAVLDYIEAYKKPVEKPIVKVDVIGNGSGVFDHLVRKDSIIAIAVDSGESSDIKRSDGTLKFVNKRAELWWSAREWLEDGAFLFRDPKLEEELRAPEYDFDTKLRYRVEKKDRIKERIKRSPDRADSLCLATFRRGTWGNGHVYKRSSQQKSKSPTRRRGNPWR